MAIPKIEEQDIAEALKYIDENGVPSHHESTKYELVTAEGKKYPPKQQYVGELVDDIFHHPMNKGSTYEGDVEQREDVCVIKHGLKIPINVENYEIFLVTWI